MWHLLTSMHISRNTKQKAHIYSNTWFIFFRYKVPARRSSPLNVLLLRHYWPSIVNINCVDLVVWHCIWGLVVSQGWGLLSQLSPFRYFPHFPLLSKPTLAIEYHVGIWQVSSQRSCGDTCQIWMWFRESNRYFCKIENFAYGEISERSFSNPPAQVRP